MNKIVFAYKLIFFHVALRINEGKKRTCKIDNQGYDHPKNRRRIQEKRSRITYPFKKVENAINKKCQ